MAHFKLNEDDDGFLNLPQGSVLVASGTDGAHTWRHSQRPRRSGSGRHPSAGAAERPGGAEA